MSGLAVNGVIEGFYGRPYGWEDRHRMVEFVAAQGGNTYVYAPKNDPRHRDRWREPYLAAEWRCFAALDQSARERGVDFWFGLSPLGLRLTDEADVAALLKKLRAADDAGLRRVCLLVDDMPEDFASTEDGARFATLAAAHVHLVAVVRGFLRERGPDRHLWFVPLHYHGDPDDDYVREIGAGIPTDVAIMWTGPEVCSERITRDHTRAVAASLRRPVLYWDNHPVNDGPMQHDPHLNPLTGRDPDLGYEALGLLANVAIQPEASLVAVATAIRYARDPVGYDHEAAWRDALDAVCGNRRDADAVAALQDLARRSPLRRGDYRLANRLRAPLRHVTDRFDAPGEDRVALLDDLRGRLADLLDTARHLRDGLTNERLRTDLAPWSTKLAHQAEGAVLAVDLLAAALRGGTDGTADGADAVLGCFDRARATFHWVAADQLEVFARWCLARAEEPLTSAAPRPA